MAAPQWFSGNPLNRSAGSSKDTAFCEAALASPSSRFLLVADDGHSLCLLCRDSSVPTHDCIVGSRGDFRSYTNDARVPLRTLVFLSSGEIKQLSGTEAAPSDQNSCLLGGLPSSDLDVDGAVDGFVWHWAMRITDEAARNALATAARGNWVNGRGLIGRPTMTDSASDGKSVPVSQLVLFSRPDVAIGGQALALWSWHGCNSHGVKTGRRSILAEAGSRRVEVGDGHGRGKAYPRTDLAAIFCVLSPCENFVLLGKSARFVKAGRAGFFSCLAGFVEQAEAVEETVRREALEEAGVTVGAVRLFCSQPWPIGRAGSCELMLGAFAHALPAESENKKSNALPDVQPLDGELAEVRWFSRDEACAMLQRAEQGVVDGDVVPGEYAIAYHLIRAWAVEGFAFEKKGVTGSTPLSQRPRPQLQEAAAKSSLVAGAAVGVAATFAALAVLRLLKSKM